MSKRKAKIVLLCSVFCFLIQTTLAAGKMTREEYISLHKSDAIKDMKRTGVPASITLAQAVFESEDGNSPLALEANNHFGIKCANDWNGPTFTKDDDKKDECFRKYRSVLESYDDHSAFLKARPRYSILFELKPTDYKGWARGLKKCGYATNPKYADQLIKIIEDYQLYKLDEAQENNLTASLSGASSNNDHAAIDKPADEGLKPVFKPSTHYNHRSSESNYVDPLNESRTVFTNNEVPYVLAKKEDTYDKIAREYEMMPGLIYKYNDVPKNASVKEGQIIYIKPKRRSAAEDFYVVKDGDSMQSISQQFGIKMKMLYKKNNLDERTEVHAGQKLWLKDKKS